MGRDSATATKAGARARIGVRTWREGERIVVMRVQTHAGRRSARGHYCELLNDVPNPNARLSSGTL